MKPLGLREPESPSKRASKRWRRAFNTAIYVSDVIINSVVFGFVVTGVFFVAVSLIRAYADNWYYLNLFAVAVISYFIIHVIAMFLGRVYSLLTPKSAMPPTAAPRLALNQEYTERTTEEQHAIFLQAQKKVVQNIIVQGRELEKLYDEEPGIYAKYPIIKPRPDQRQGLDQNVKPDHFPETRPGVLAGLCPPMPGAIPPCSAQFPPKPNTHPVWCAPGYCTFHRGINPKAKAKQYQKADWNYRLPEPKECENLQTWDVYDPHDDLHVEDRKEYLEKLRAVPEEQKNMETEVRTEQAQCVCGPSISAGMRRRPKDAASTTSTITRPPRMETVKTKSGEIRERPFDAQRYFKLD
jgi:hypothetical protein